jgi:hypothetical protein
MGGAGVEPATSSWIREALCPPELSACSGRSWARTSGLLLVREALYLLSYTPSSKPRGTRTLESLLRLAQLPTTRVLAELASLSIPGAGDRRSGERLSVAMAFPLFVRSMPDDVSMPLAYPSTLDLRSPAAHIRGGRSPTWRSFGARTSSASWKIRRLKLTLPASVHSSALRRGLSLSSGASIRSRTSSS